MDNFRIDKQIILLVSLLTTIGLVMVFSVSSYSEIDTAKIVFDTFFKQIAWVFMGIIAMYFISSIQTNKLKQFSPVFMVLSFIFLLLVLILGVEKNGAQRWINVAFFNIQPIEFAKISFVIFLAKWLSEKKVQLHSIKTGMVPVLIILTIFSILIMLQPDYSSTLLLIVIVFILFALSNIPFSKVLNVGILGALVMVVLLVAKGYRMGRLIGLTNPVDGPYGDQATQGLIAIGSGGVWGVGYAASIIKRFFLQAADTDYIFAIIGEEFGLFGITIILILFFLLFMRLFKVINRTKSDFEWYLAAGLTSILLLNYFVNIAVVLKLLPVTGIPLPFISYGGSHLLSEFVIIGILLNLSKSVKQRKNLYS